MVPSWNKCQIGHYSSSARLLVVLTLLFTTITVGADLDAAQPFRSFKAAANFTLLFHIYPPGFKTDGTALPYTSQSVRLADETCSMRPTRRQDSVLADDQAGFQYHPLSTQRNEIRILYLIPGQWTEDVKCQLTTRSLDDKPLFHALSYSWGHHNERASISVDGKTFKISISLESALRQIRQEDQSLSIWVDKLCINQRDEEEKAQQISLMARIYQQCSNVLIWLGAAEAPVQAAKKYEVLRRYSMRSDFDETPLGDVLSTTLFCCFGQRHAYREIDDYLDDPFDIVMHFAADRHIHELSCFRPSRFRRNKLRFRETRQFRAMWIRFRQLLETSWHSRFWCVQEALLAKNAWIIHGSWRIPFATIRQSLQNHKRHLSTCCSKVEKLFPTTYAFCPDSLYLAPAPTHNLDLLLRAYRYKDCRNPRDKIFGILALASSATTLKVDYTQSVAQVYTAAMSLIIAQARGSLSCLTGQGFSSPHHNLPSWVRDFSQLPGIATVQFEMQRLEAYELFDACRGLTGPPLSQIDEDELQVSGRYVDTIETVCLPLNVPVEQIDWRYALSVLLSWRRAAKIPRRSLLRPDVHTQPFWRCILGDTIWEPGSSGQGRLRRFEDADVQLYESWLRQSLLDWLTFRKPRIRDEFVQALLAASYGRAMFMTAGGKIGLCGPDARTGDEVWILRGGRVPFALRQGEEGTMGLVGDCYLHGFMDGKFLTENEEEIVVLC